MLSPRTLRNLRGELRDSHLAKLGIALVVFVLVVAALAPLLAPHDPTTQELDDSLLPPVGFDRTENVSSSEMVDGELKIVNETKRINASPEHPLGTDNLGRDMLSRVIYGARTSLLVGILGTLVAAVIGVTVGLVAGYYGGRVDDSLMRAADVMLAFPSLVLAIALIGVWDRAIVWIPDPIVTAGFVSGRPERFPLSITLVVVVGLVNWVWFARVARGEALSVRAEEYVTAAESVGASHLYIIRKHVFPNSVTPILVLGTIQVAAIILLESALSFLGLSGTTLSWGFDIAQGREYQTTAWWISTVPGLAIVLTVIGINLVGDWLRDAFDPGIQGEGNA